MRTLLLHDTHKFLMRLNGKNMEKLLSVETNMDANDKISIVHYILIRT